MQTRLKGCWEFSEVTQAGGRARGRSGRMLNEKGILGGGRGGGVIPNTCNDKTSLASFQL